MSSISSINAYEDYLHLFICSGDVVNSSLLMIIYVYSWLSLIDFCIDRDG